MNNNESFLKDIYNKPNTGLKSSAKFYKYIKEKYPNRKITLKEIKDFIDKQVPNQLFKRVNNKNLYNKTIAYFVADTLQTDTLDFNTYKSQNKGLRYILVCIDVYSRKIGLRSLRNKSANEIVKVMKGIRDEITENGYTIKNIITDVGTEYKNKNFYDLFQDVQIFHKKQCI